MRSKLLVPAVAVLLVAGCSESPLPTTARSVVPDGDSRPTRPRTPIRGEWAVELHVAVADKPGAMQEILRSTRGRLKSNHLEIANGFMAYMSDSAAQALRAHPSVRSVTQNERIAANPPSRKRGLEPLDLLTTQTPADWGLDRIDQRHLPLNNQFTYDGNGAGTHIYILSSGIRQTHVEFGGRATYDAVFVGDGQGFVDVTGAGTALAGVAAGNTYGVAKGARIHAVRVVSSSSGDLSSIINGLDWVRNNRISPAVALMPLGFPGAQPLVDNATLSLINSGVTMVLAGLQDGDCVDESPQRLSEPIVLAATDRFDVRTLASSDGPCIDLYAPGLGVNTSHFTSNTAIVPWDGSGIAAAFTTGVAAVMLQKFPSFSNASVQSRLISESTTGVVVGPGLGTPNRLLFAPPRTSAPTVSIIGPYTVRSNAMCLWSANASGGVPPYTYNWYLDGGWAGSGPELTARAPSHPFPLQVTVTDAAGSSSQSQRNVNVAPLAPMCRF